MAGISDEQVEDLKHELSGAKGIKVAGIDCDGILRGKVMQPSKFFSALKNDGFGFCSVTFGWDMHDKTYDGVSSISNTENGFTDITAKVDVDSKRLLPWDDQQPFFLLTFHDISGSPIPPCPRSLLAAQADKAKDMGFKCMAGLELEFFNFHEDPASLGSKAGRGLTHLTPGNFGYSMLRPMAKHTRDYFKEIYEQAIELECPIEGWHTETGPGVYEAALAFDEVTRMADNGTLFKFLCKSLGLKHGITPCFMAKPVAGMSGNSGHIHMSLADPDGTNLFARNSTDEASPYPDVKDFSDIGRYFTAGVLEGLPDIMPLLAPNINSYKRLVENYWAPVDVSWGLEHRLASVRLIAPPTCAPKATRIEIRVPGADIVPHYAMAALLGLGLRGIEKKLAFSMPPLGHTPEPGTPAKSSIRLAKDLKEATVKFMAPGSLAREVLGDAFVEHFGFTRQQEIKQWEMTVTDWEVSRYMETV
ncbi:glutamate-ammonia ligase [Protomyces lactucae-debilis]|uniref:Glutamate-ammonia ligase n=1 Tax=Protomyces lactucae-debilis TaxID=2754530 RepID=A0A1Y2EWS4_PROLT|nr:glutamate-ammonia ligase [Protomyces lactucae-debilis]ORY76052.1 glutamate-ammonia ligase [Protomyces lactucae-debilis]